MPAYTGTQVFFKVGATNLSNFWKRVNLERSVTEKETTRGNVQHIQRAPGKKDTKMTATIGYDTNLASILAALAPGTVYTCELGPEGNVAGEPKHIQDFLLLSAPFEVTVDNDEVAFELSFSAADAPASDMYAGATY